MPTFQKFEDIEAWQKARSLAREIYRVSGESELRHDYGLRDQMRRSAVSVVSKIAEGFERDSVKEFIRFLNMA